MLSIAYAITCLRLQALFPLALVLMLVGCSTSGGEVGSLDEQALKQEKAVPIALRVLEDYLEGGKLRVLVELSSKAFVDPRIVNLELIGLRDGDVVSKQTANLSSFVEAKTIEPGAEIKVPLEVLANRLTEYQVLCSWGSVAIEEQKPDEQLIIPSLAVRYETPTDCLDNNCKPRAVLEGTVINYSSSTISDIQLALGVYWFSSRQKQVFPGPLESIKANENRVLLEGVSLTPGASKLVRVKLDRALPSVAGGAFVPHLRVLSFRAE